ncbi:MAG TPA: HEAT repeat domain-containing protein [Pyrinomonadaceae bacterium]|nr:HEAT repeat domain-containing protein [Pyrinomonadaceae bacterium]
MTISRNLPRTALPLVLFLVAFVSFHYTSVARSSTSVAGHTVQGSLTPLQFEIEKQARRMSSAETEERREALTRLGSMHHPEASRAALPALHDSVAIVRATAASAILSLPHVESVGYLVPLLTDKDEFVRREVAFALGKTHSQSAVQPLVERLNSDKKDSVRGAAAVALGELKDASATLSLAEILSPGYGTAARSSKKSKKGKDLFLLRATAHSLGQIGSSAGVPALVTALQDEKMADDVRRESAFALGLIGDAAAVPALRSVEAAGDPYLAEAAHQAIRKIERQAKPVNGN